MRIHDKLKTYDELNKHVFVSNVHAGRSSGLKHRNNDSATNLEAIKLARKYSIKSAAKKFDVTRNRIQEWMKQEDELKRQVNDTAGGSKRKRLDGGGRQVKNPDLDVHLAEWIREKRENKQPVSRRIIRNKVEEIFSGTDLKISNGWLEKFLKRNSFVNNNRTETTGEICRSSGQVHRPPGRKEESHQVQFNLRHGETAVWFDCPANTCIETKGAKDVTVVTTGHEKMRITVCLAARSDGKKLLPYVLVKNKRPIPQLVEKFNGKLIINWNGSVWMDDSTTADFLKQIIGRGGPFSCKRLLVWDAFAEHISEKTKVVLKKIGVEAAIIPGGCTKLFQVPDVSCNKPLKEKIRLYYTTWMSNDAQKEFTKGGNPKAPALEFVLEWVDRHSKKSPRSSSSNRLKPAQSPHLQTAPETTRSLASSQMDPSAARD